MSDLGEGELTFEVRARSDLEVVETSLGVKALDDLSVNGTNEA